MATAVVPRVFKNYINGEWSEAASGRAFENRNPANTDELVGIFPDSTAEDVDAAVDAARAAFQSWRLVPAPKRAEILFRAAEILSKRKETLAHEMTREMGKVLDETRGDVQEAMDMTYYMAGEGRRLWGQTTPSELREKFAMSVRQPLGVCAMITPWNFPMAIPSWKIMPALICGNTVVIKPAEDTPLSTYNLVQILSEAGLPRGVVNVVNGAGPEAGAPLVRHPKIAAVSFTGSTEVGRIVAEATAPSFKPCHLEMGGKNILIVLEDANLDLAVEGAVWGGFGTAGQRCTAASRVAVHKNIYKQFLDKFAARVKTLKVGDGLDPATQMGPVINEKQLQTVMEYVAIGKKEGARLVTGGNRLTGGPFAHGWFHEPTVFADCDPTHAHRAGGDFRAGGGRDAHERLRAGHRDRQRRGLRPFGFDLHARREQRLRGHARPAHRHRLRERSDHRRRDPFAIRRHQADRQRPSRGGYRGAGFLFRVENVIRGLLRSLAARPN